MEETADQTTCSAVILAGGLNSRMGGRNKAFLKVGNKTILDRLIEAIGALFEEILLVTRQPEIYKELPARIKLVEDIFKKRSSLTGIHAGLANSDSPYCFIAPCDTPFIQPELVRFMCRAIDPEADVIVPAFEDHYEPLCAIYSKRCLPYIEDQLRRDDFKIIHFFDKISLKPLPVTELKKADPSLHSFFNVNTPEHYRNSLDVVKSSL